MEAMVIRRAEPREDRAAAEKLSREVGVAEKFGEVESLPFGIEVGIGGEHWNEKMAPIGGENNGIGFRGYRASLGFELPIKKFVEGAERAGSVEKFTRVHAESFDETGYFFDRGSAVGPASVEPGKPRAFDDPLEAGTAERRFVGPPEGFFPINSLLLESTFVAVEVTKFFC